MPSTSPNMLRLPNNLEPAPLANALELPSLIEQDNALLPGTPNDLPSDDQGNN
jgi:hypothetical protein